MYAAGIRSLRLDFSRKEVQKMRNRKKAQKVASLVTFATDKQKCAAHGTQKPVALCEWLIRSYTNEGDTVLDFCMGSGSTGVAAINTNRNFIGIEKDADFFDVAKERIADATQSR